MISETLTVKAARKSCQAGCLYRAVALKTNVAVRNVPRNGVRMTLGTNGRGRVSKEATAQLGIRDGQGSSASPIPSPGENK